MRTCKSVQTLAAPDWRFLYTLRSSSQSCASRRREPSPLEPGDFESSTDVGRVVLPGAVEFDAAKGQYRVSGSGANIWGNVDAFQFVWKKVSGDLELLAQVRWQGDGENAHRKAGWMVRQDLSADSPYADAVVHGDGLISLQYRRVRSGPTLEVKAASVSPATIKLERTGDLFTLSVVSGDSARPAGSRDGRDARGSSCWFGGVFSRHDRFGNCDFRGGEVQECAGGRRPNACARIDAGNRDDRQRAAPGGLPGQGAFRGTQLVSRKTERLSSSTGGGRIYTLPVEGGAPHAPGHRRGSPLQQRPRARARRPVAGDQSPRRADLAAVGHLGLVEPRWHAEAGHARHRPSCHWHGWSPDGQTLAYCAQRDGEFDIYTIMEAGGDEKRLTTAKGLDDGPDYTPDGKRIYFNSDRTGVMKIWRMNSDGTDQEQVTTGPDHVDWFPHPSPDGKWLVFLSYEKTVTGHPADKDVVLRIMPLEGGTPRILATLFGGQGTINVPSWSPELIAARAVAFVSYRMVGR